MVVLCVVFRTNRINNKHCSFRLELPPAGRCLAGLRERRRLRRRSARCGLLLRLPRALEELRLERCGRGVLPSLRGALEAVAASCGAALRPTV